MAATTAMAAKAATSVTAAMVRQTMGRAGRAGMAGMQQQQGQWPCQQQQQFPECGVEHSSIPPWSKSVMVIYVHISHFLFAVVLKITRVRRLVSAIHKSKMPFLCGLFKNTCQRDGQLWAVDSISYLVIFVCGRFKNINGAKAIINCCLRSF